MRINNTFLTFRLGAAAVCVLSLLAAHADSLSPPDSTCLNNAATSLAEVYSSIKFAWDPDSGFKITPPTDDATKKHNWSSTNKACLDAHQPKVAKVLSNKTPFANLLNSGLVSFRVETDGNKKKLVLWFDDPANSTPDINKQDKEAAANPIDEIDKNTKAAIAEFRLKLNVVFPVLFIITIVISIFLYLLQKKLQKSIVRLDEADKKLDEADKKFMELTGKLDKADKKLMEANNTIGQMRKDYSEKRLQQESSSEQTDQKIIHTFKELYAKYYNKTEQQIMDLQSRIVDMEPRINELRKFVNDEIEQLKYESEQWKKWEEEALTEYRTLMQGNKTREEIKPFRERYAILDIKPGSHGTFQITDMGDDDSFLWAMKQSDNQYLVVPSDKFYNNLSAFYANEQRLAHDAFSGVMEFVPHTGTTSESLIKPGVVILKEGVFMVRRRGELVI